MALLIKNASQALTCTSRDNLPKKGKHQQEPEVISNAYVVVNEGKIVHAGNEKSALDAIKNHTLNVQEEIDVSGKIILPGLIDCHTHLPFSGNREQEYEKRIAGKTYQQIADEGGGILTTVNAVRNASKKELLDPAEKRIQNFASFGVTTLEAKTGYGLDTKNELKQLDVINTLNESSHIDIIPTFLGAHAIPDGQTSKSYLELIINEMLPKVKGQAKFIDAFCETGYFSADEIKFLFNESSKHGLTPKLHTNQFTSIGGIEAAIETGCISVDHLEIMTEKEIKALAKANEESNITAVLLPGVSYFINIPYAPARRLIENNIPIALSTDFNPGSCNTENIQLIMSLASLQMKMTAEEIINAVTINAAAALGLQNKIGSIEPGKNADFAIFDTSDYRDIIYHFGVNMVDSVIKNGIKIIN